MRAGMVVWALAAVLCATAGADQKDEEIRRLRAENAALRKEVTRLRTEVKGLKSRSPRPKGKPGRRSAEGPKAGRGADAGTGASGDREQIIQDLKTKATALNEALMSLGKVMGMSPQQRKAAQAELAAKAAEVRRTMAATRVPDLADALGGQVVYITGHNRTYHRSECRHVAKTKIPVLLLDAKKRHYRPCGQCKPPE